MADSRKIELIFDGTLPERKEPEAPQPAKVSHGEAVKAMRPTLPLEAHRRDRERQARAKRDLEATLENYFATLTRFGDIEITTLAEIVGAYACEVYDSRAEGYMAIPSWDPETLFGVAGPLSVGPTLADVERCLATLKVRRPWKIPSSDSIVGLLDDGRELMGLHYEHPWFTRQIGDIVARRVQDTRKAYSQGAAARATEGGFPRVDLAGDTEASVDESTRTGAGPAEPEPTTTGRKRGRPQTIPDERKVRAAALKASGGTNSAVAAVLYDKKFPTPQEVKNVHSHLRAFSKKLKRPGSSVQTSPKSPEIKG